MTSHKSPSAQRWSANADSREILTTRRAVAHDAKEGTQAKFVSAYPKHPKVGRILSSPSSSATVTGGHMKGKPYDSRKVTRQIERPLGAMNWELTL